MTVSRFRLVASLLQLGDATSRNLEFSHRDDVFVSYGEETITESNLLELRRRHPQRVRLEMFTKHQEAVNGADWEWHIIGRRLSLKMRVQAKRLQRNGVLRVRHKVKSSGMQQRQLLIDNARAENMKAVYCIYCAEPQRRIWTQGAVQGSVRPFQTGCLLADALDVPASTKNLQQIEEKCFPWHFLFDQVTYVHTEAETGPVADDHITFVVSGIAPIRTPVEGFVDRGSVETRWNLPTVEELNDDSKREFDRTGVGETTAEDLYRLRPETEVGERQRRRDLERLRERGIHRMLLMDVRDVFD